MDVERLEKISRQSGQNPDKIWKNLHRLLCSEKLWILSYEKQKSNAGAITPAMNPDDTLQGMSLDRFRKTILSLKNDSWKPQLIRQIQIPKPGKVEKRPLGIQGGTDKILQGVVLLILEAIYEPLFRPHSYGFRPGIGNHDALKYIENNFNGITHVLEGDIKACFPTIHHKILITLLQKRISDERFLNVIKKMLKAGVWDIQTNKLLTVNKGTPQGSIVSPILANIYLHEMDLFIEEWYKNNVVPLHKGRETQKLSKPAVTIKSKIQILQKQENPNIKEIRFLKIKKLNMVAIAPESIKPRLIYVRYADDFVIGTNLDIHNIERLKSDLTLFLKENLQLALNQEKSNITDIRKESIFFLGFNIKIDPSQKISLIQQQNRSPYLKRTTGYFVKLCIPMQLVINKLALKGICKGNGKPISISRMTSFDDQDIISYGSALLRGILNYYAPTVSTVYKHRIRYIIKFSLLHTFAQKHRSSVSSMLNKYGPDIEVKYKHTDTKGNLTERSIKLDKVNSKLKWRLGHQYGDIYSIYLGKYSKSRIGKNCALCQSTEYIQMHHIRSIKNITPNTFNELHGYINRLQIPLCRVCHNLVTKGKYDGMSIRDLLKTLPQEGDDSYINSLIK